MKQNIIVIVGPTASGKSALAVQLAKKLNGEVISADSRQVYKGLNIGSGKITKKEMWGVRHHMLDVCSPKKVFTAADFVSQGRKAIEEIVARGKIPIVGGGTGFYIDAILGRIVLPDVLPDAKLRARLQKLSAEQLFSILKKLDPARAKSIDRHNPVRLVRAIEIATKIGKVPAKKSNLAYDSQWVGIMPGFEELDKKISIRLTQRMRCGMLREVKRLHEKGLSWKRMEQLGLEYRYLALYLQSKISKEEMLSELELRIRQYARRQIIYWKRNKDIKWFTSAHDAERFIIKKMTAQVAPGGQTII